MSIENPKTGGTTTIAYVVMSVLNRLRDYSMRHYSFLEQIVIECFSELNIFHLNNIEVVYLKMSDQKTVDLPADFVDWSKIGVPMGGEIRVLTRNTNILMPRELEGQPIGGGTAGQTKRMMFADHFRDGRFIAGLYGLVGGVDTAYYDVDRERRQIIFSGSIPRGVIVLEYISTGVSVSSGTIIPREAVPTLRAYALWQIIENDGKASMNEKERKKSQFEEQLNQLIYFQTAFTIDEYKRRVWRSTKQTTKR